MFVLQTRKNNQGSLQFTYASKLAHMIDIEIYPYFFKNLIYFVKIRPPDFLCNEFLIKMYRLLQNYTLKSVPFQREWIFVVNTIFFTGRSLFTSDRKVDTLFHGHVHWFATIVLKQFSLSLLIFIDIKMFLKVYQQIRKNNFDVGLFNNECP